MKYINASIIQIELQSDKYVKKPYPKYLHGLCYYLAGKDYPHEKYRPPMFHPSIMKWKGNKEWGTHAIILISSINKDLTSNILQSLEKVNVLRLGFNEMQLKTFTIQKQETIPLDAKVTIPVPDEFKISFNTPTRFRTRETDHYITKAYPELNLLIRSMARNVHILYGVKIGLKEQEELTNSIMLIDVIGYPIQAKIDRKSEFEDCFIGEIHISCRKLNQEQKKLFGILLRTAKYSGVGHKKGYGFGQIQIKRPTI
ncbi:CRISPR system precrRNA processing endoribonuclease RAMP protein Cas6 [Oceanobacillus bengalensis]|uniref:CRISPR system precrRNA processing endoribonuclease RAMP protein Cas6 n=1 Tax=Oceanobacillus bengalensis TaxID=1435466 RepID=A0A494Z6V0_9BACI|nr:CRISPR system precrRNA processing endoribonuclease RAMP protein Cas6 [Oceanobacillus bengalensis]RKQ18300.1 CRISPR system precrRNA processing endoribonuclease RAMP protein Cas6 [Oceanobacillus bengalensis]